MPMRHPAFSASPPPVVAPVAVARRWCRLAAARPQDLRILDAGAAGSAAAVIALLEGPIGAVERALSGGAVRDAPGLGSLALGVAGLDADGRRHQQTSDR